MVKINIVSPGRFHVCDLARELDRNGWDVRFYSFVPTMRTKKFGLPAKCNKSIFPFIAPFLLLQKYVKKGWAKQLRIYIQDIITSIYMRRCDILIAMSGDFVHTVDKAKQNGVLVILERGSKHILEQKKVLESIPALKGTNPVPDVNVKRELRDYKNADYIAVASKHVAESFAKHNFDLNKIFVNPYGVDLSMFHPAEDMGTKEYDVIMVGNWGYQKGCDLIVEAIKRTKYRFLHVGGIGDLPFPEGDERFTHVDAVDQSKLVDYYTKAKVFVFPSRQDGFGMVLSQAVACNLPIVGSKDCGAPDLKNMVELPEYIKLIDEYTPEAVKAALDASMAAYEEMKGQVYAGDAIDNLTWKAYGDRYSAFLSKMGGVNLTILKLHRKYDVIMVGGWSYRKGCDLIVEAIKQSDYRFLHVGGIVDMPFPEGDERFTHVDSVDQSKLVDYYTKAKVFVFPSREDGFGMVLSQAVACNLPIVGSKDCGAPDLKNMVELPEYIKLIDEYTPEAVKEALDASMAAYEEMKGQVYAGDAIDNLTWKAYGDRYSAFLSKMGGGKSNHTETA